MAEKPLSVSWNSRCASSWDCGGAADCAGFGGRDSEAIAVNASLGVIALRILRHLCSGNLLILMSLASVSVTPAGFALERKSPVVVGLSKPYSELFANGSSVRSDKERRPKVRERLGRRPRGEQGGGGWAVPSLRILG